MREWIPTSGSARGRLVRAALAEFGKRPYDQVGVAELAEAAGATTGPLYHHFGSKLGLYTTVREDVERRVVDRLEGALAVTPSSDASAPMTALTVAFDYLVRAELAALVDQPHPSRQRDAIVAALAGATGQADDTLAELLVAAWRAALGLVVRGHVAAEVRQTFGLLRIDPGAHS